jgi:predicted transcriptional regulator
MRKQHQTNENSTASFKECLASGQIGKEKRTVLNALLKYGACTSRMLSTYLGIERTNITRSIYNLVNTDNLVVVACNKPCITTGKTVTYYMAKDTLEGS